MTMLLALITTHYNVGPAFLAILSALQFNRKQFNSPKCRYTRVYNGRRDRLAI
jgi:hypothetical protein